MVSSLYWSTSWWWALCPAQHSHGKLFILPDILTVNSLSCSTFWWWALYIDGELFVPLNVLMVSSLLCSTSWGWALYIAQHPDNKHFVFLFFFLVYLIHPMLDIHVISLGKGVEGTGNSARVCQFVCSSTARVITRTDSGTQPRAPITSASAAKRQLFRDPRCSHLRCAWLL